MFPYITADQLRAHLAKENINHDDQLKLIRIDVSRQVEKRCGRIFRVAEDQQRTAKIDSQGRIPVIDLIAATEILIDVNNDGAFTHSVSLSDVNYLPEEQENGEPSGRYDYIVAAPGSAAVGFFNCGARARVTGDWGYVETLYAEDDDEADQDDMPPAGVSYACLMLCARYYKRKESPLSVQSMPGFGFKRLIDEDKDIRDQLAPFIHERKRRVIQ